MHDVSIAGRKKKVAEAWNELTREQLLRLMPILYGAYTDLQRQRIELLWVLFGINWALGLAITPVQYVQILPLTDFLLAETVGLTAQLLPSVQLRWYRLRLWGPSGGFRNLRFLEFVFADSYFMAYANSQEEQWLNRLLAVLYRPQRFPYFPNSVTYGGDRRQDFNENLIDARAQQLAQLPQAEKLAILTWYRGCRQALEQRYPHVFTPDHEQQATDNTGGWAHVLREMSGQAFGTVDETGRQHLHMVLAKMEEDSQRALELQRQAKAQQAAY
jgi:dsDNA-binding SOS-regulon protein